MAKKITVQCVWMDEAELLDMQKICRKRGSTQTASYSRLVRWFVRQDPLIQTAILAAGTDPERIQALEYALVRSWAGSSRFVAPAYMADAAQIEAELRKRINQ